LSTQPGLRPLSDSQRRALEEATSAYQDQLTAEAADYLEARGLNPMTVLDARLGLVADPLPGHGPFRGRLTIPYFARTGTVVGLKFRPIGRVPDSEQKYLQLPGPIRLYEPPMGPLPTDTIHITEGEIDALTLAQCGLPAVGVPGAQVWREWMTNRVESPRRVLIWADPDPAGNELAETISEAVPHAQVVRLSGGDVNEIYQAEGAQALLAHIKQ
jgi:DNA primase